MKKVNKYYLILLEPCCSLCKDLHKNHKLIEINDIEALQKENITIESVKNIFNDIYDEIVSLKNKILKEIKNVDVSYEKALEDIRNGYIKKHEQLVQEENDLIEKLRFEETKYKDMLENLLTEYDNSIKLREKINKGMTKMENEEKKMLKVLSYISKANQTHKDMLDLSQKMMENVNFIYNEEKSDLIFEKYYFNGVPIPKNIEFRITSYSSLKVYWDIENINIKDYDPNDIKYNLQIKTGNENFKTIYIGSKKYCYIINLFENTNYEIRVCLLYRDKLGIWSEIKNVKTPDFKCECNILKENNKKNEFIRTLLQWTDGTELDLIYRGTRDGIKGTTFYEKYDKISPTVTLIQDEKGSIFGGYASKSWIFDKKYFDFEHNIPDSFIFTLENIYNIQPTKFPIKLRTKRHNTNFIDLLSYCNGLGFAPSNDLINGISVLGGGPYEDIIGKGRSIFTGEPNDVYKEIKIKEIEVFKLIQKR